MRRTTVKRLRASRRSRWPVAIALLAALALVPAVAAEGADRASPQKAAVKKAFKQLISETRDLPKRAASKRDRGALLKKAKSAKRLSRRKPCKSVRAMAGFRKLVEKKVEERPGGRRVVGAGSVRGELEAAALEVDAALMQLPKARACGGGEASTATEAGSSVLSSDEKHVSFRVNFPQPTFAAQQVGDDEFQRMFMEGTGESGDVGDPGPPIFSSFFAVPLGADVSVTVNDAKGYDLKGVELFPVQKEPVDGKPSGIPALEQIDGLPPVSTFMPGPFQIDKKAYDSKAKFPPTPSDAAVLGGDQGPARRRRRLRRRPVHSRRPRSSTSTPRSR